MKELFFHPAFQSAVFPGVLSAVGLAALWYALPATQRRWSAVASVLALAATLALLPGWHWPAGSAAQKLPWILAAGGVLAAVLEAARASAWTHWAAASLGWALASQWLAGAWAMTPAALVAPLAGAGVLACLTATLLRTPAPSDTRRSALRGAAAVAALTVASLGLAGLAAFGGSLLLAQLAAMHATVGGVLAVFGLWTGLRSGSAGASHARPVAAAIGQLALMPLGLVWLAIAQVASVSVPGTAAPEGAEDLYYEPRWK